MKYLSNYTEDATTELLEENGAFFAFSNSQFDEQKKEGVKYVRFGGAGLIVPKENAARVHEGLPVIRERGITLDLAENGKDAIILRELNNHECFYCGSYDDPNFEASLNGYGFKDEDIKRVYGANYKYAAL